ncbi:MAG: cell division protein ZapA [Bacteroidales bacterium]|nr:cell division protein ZapA [Bacteroidales bacterium]
MSELPATIRILDRPYKMRVKSEDEQFLLQAAELINTQAKSYSKMYAYNDRQDLLAMVALTQITQLLKLHDKQQFKDTGLEKRLTGISQLLDSVEKGDNGAEAMKW